MHDDIRIHISEDIRPLKDLPYGPFAVPDKETGEIKIYLKAKDPEAPFGYKCYSLIDGKYTDFGSQSLYLTDRNRVFVTVADLVREDGEPYNGFLTREDEVSRLPVEAIGYENRICNALRRGGCGMVGDVRELIENDQIGTIKGLGEKSTQVIEDKYFEFIARKNNG